MVLANVTLPGIRGVTEMQNNDPAYELSWYHVVGKCVATKVRGIMLIAYGSPLTRKIKKGTHKR